MTRIVTALILIPFIAWVTLASPPWVFLAVLAITGLLAYSEFDHIAAAQGVDAMRFERIGRHLAIERARRQGQQNQQKAELQPAHRSTGHHKSRGAVSGVYG